MLSSLLRPVLRKLLKSQGLASDPAPLATWLSEVRRAYEARRPSTRVRTVQAAREAAALAGPDATTAALDVGLLDRYAESKLAKGDRAETINGLLRGLRAACSLAVDRGWLDFNPFLDWDGWVDADEEPLKSRHHPMAEVARVLSRLRDARSATWEGGRLYALAMVWGHAGLRLREGLRLDRADVDFAASTLRVIGRGRGRGRRLKTRRSAAHVPMTDALSAALAEWLPMVQGSAWVFPGIKRLGPWTGGKGGGRAGDRLKSAAEAAGVPGMTPHTLRHSLSTHLRGAWGLSPKQLQMILRHSNMHTQELYVKEDLANLVALVRGFDYSA